VESIKIDIKNLIAKELLRAAEKVREEVEKKKARRREEALMEVRRMSLCKMDTLQHRLGIFMVDNVKEETIVTKQQVTEDKFMKLLQSALSLLAKQEREKITGGDIFMLGDFQVDIQKVQNRQIRDKEAPPTTRRKSTIEGVLEAMQKKKGKEMDTGKVI